jgi:hypothetical protein
MRERQRPGEFPEQELAAWLGLAWPIIQSVVKHEVKRLGVKI